MSMSLVEARPIGQYHPMSGYSLIGVSIGVMVGTSGPVVADPAVPPATVHLSPNELVAQAPKQAWHDIPATDLLVMHLSTGARIILQLNRAFAPAHVANILRLAETHWWDGTSINRVQDNYVVQWGDATEKKLLPAGVGPVAAEYSIGSNTALRFPVRDAYASWGGFDQGWPVAAAVEKGKPQAYWLPHCYAMVGVGRDFPPDTGTGAELYVVIGHAPRHLDRNLAVVGRVIDGMAALSSLPRGTGALGFYEKPEQRQVIVRVRRMTDLPPEEQTRWQYLATESKDFAAYVEARSNRCDAFFVYPSGGADLCNIPVPLRQIPR